MDTDLHYSCDVDVSPIKRRLGAALGFNALCERFQEQCSRTATSRPSTRLQPIQQKFRFRR